MVRQAIADVRAHLAETHDRPWYRRYVVLVQEEIPNAADRSD